MPKSPTGVNGTGNTSAPQETRATGDSASPPGVQNTMVQGYFALSTTAEPRTSRLVNFFAGVNQPSSQRSQAQPLQPLPSAPEPAPAQAAGTTQYSEPTYQSDRTHDTLPSALLAAMSDTQSVTHYIHQLMSPPHELIHVIDAPSWLNNRDNQPSETENIHEIMQRAITQCAGLDLGNLHGSTHLAHPISTDSGLIFIDVLTAMGGLSAQPPTGTNRINFTPDSGLCAIMRIIIHPASGNESAPVSLSPLTIKGKLIKEK